MSIESSRKINYYERAQKLSAPKLADINYVVSRSYVILIQ